MKIFLKISSVLLIIFSVMFYIVNPDLFFSILKVAVILIFFISLLAGSGSGTSHYKREWDEDFNSYY